MATHLKIALVEDNDDLRELLTRDIVRAGHQVQSADCAEALDDLMVGQSFDLLVLDVNLPGENGLSIARRFKAANPDIFIIMVTARVEIEDRVAGYESGADIYLPKPVSSSELTAAISSIARRVVVSDQQIQAILNIKSMTLIGTHAVELNKLEVAMLKALSESTDGNLPYHRLLEICGDEVTEASKAALEVRIVRLRKKFIDAGIAERVIKALRGDGYQLLRPIRIL
ncbi:response regulator transcription factor [Polynucleobacter brandtiae]|uniref:Two-component system phosphate regulon response regulator OmpR n=1 Tax=Polynucleobacter brandtiae TaxID=1938816 RepID=A0A2M8VZX2_9BURK|nr:response regulator transcription factor [Polynucleobacter brandtiae]PJI83402.1 two-component system phosphate regulon response regulator OmpR [Polynucleobacter brandtiae]